MVVLHRESNICISSCRQNRKSLREKVIQLLDCLQMMLMSRESRYFDIMTFCLDRRTYMYNRPICAYCLYKCGCNAIHLQISKFITATNLILYLLSRSTAFLQVPSRATRHTLAGRSGFSFIARSSKRICGEGD